MDPATRAEVENGLTLVQIRDREGVAAVCRRNALRALGPPYYEESRDAFPEVPVRFVTELLIAAIAIGTCALASC